MCIKSEVEMITEIGIVAGEIWHYLDAHNEVRFSEMLDNIDKPRDLILMSLGWLSREGHVVVATLEKDYKITLRKSS